MAIQNIIHLVENMPAIIRIFGLMMLPVADLKLIWQIVDIVNGEFITVIQLVNAFNYIVQQVAHSLNL